MATSRERSLGPGDKEALESLFSSPYRLFGLFLALAIVLSLTTYLASNSPQTPPVVPTPIADLAPSK
jgi:hypothetical protein